MRKKLLKIVLMLGIICLTGISGMLFNSAFAATPADQTFDGKGGSGTNTITLDGITYTTNGSGVIEVAGSETLTLNPTLPTKEYSGNALVNDFNFINSDYSHTPTFFQISSADLANNFKMTSMYLIINDIYLRGHKINIEGLDGGKNGTLVASAYGIDMSASGYYGTDTVTVANQINDSANGEYGGILTFGDNWGDIDTIVITSNNEGNAVYAVIDSLDFSNVVDVSVSDATAVTEGGNAKFTISLSKPYRSPVTVNYDTADNTAKAADDYTITTGSAIIPKGQTSVEVTVPTRDDKDYEEAESFYLKLSNPSVGGITDGQGECAINDNDSQPTVELESGSSFSENGGTAVIKAMLSNKSYQPVTVNLSYSGTATSGMDYTTSDNKIVIPAGSLSNSITITGKDDDIYEGSETVITDISLVTNGIAGSIKQVTATITDDDSKPKVSLSVSPLSFSEDGGTAEVTATLSNKSYQDVTVDVGLTGTAVKGADYTVLADSIIIPAGSLTGSITLTAKDNAVYQGDKTVTVVISSVTNGTENGIQQIKTDILEDEVVEPSSQYLSNLTISSGTLTPVFNKNTYSYSANVGCDVTSITITPTSEVPVAYGQNATIKVNGVTVASGAGTPVNLAFGVNTIYIDVTSAVGNVTQRYALTVTRASSPYLTKVDVTYKNGRNYATKSITIITNQAEYTVDIANTADSVTIKPTSQDANATILINGRNVPSGQTSASIPVVIGSTQISINVTSKTGTDSRAYKISIT